MATDINKKNEGTVTISSTMSSKTTVISRPGDTLHVRKTELSEFARKRLTTKASSLTGGEPRTKD